MNNLLPRSLNYLLNLVSDRDNLVLWVRSIDYQRQLYLSDSYQNIWGHSNASVYEHPESWNDYLYSDDVSRLESIIQQRVKSKSIIGDSLLFRIRTSENKINHIVDKPFKIVDDQGNDLAFAGISESISEDQWVAKFKQGDQFSDLGENDEFKEYLLNVLQNESKRYNIIRPELPNISKPFSVFMFKDSGAILPTSQRESECLQHLFNGKSAKQTAAVLGVSVRTIEFHLTNIKAKAHCRTKIELLSKLISR